MSDQTEGALAQPARNRYSGLGGLYAVVDGEVFPADEAGRPLPHTHNEDGTPMAPPPAPAPTPQE